MPSAHNIPARTERVCEPCQFHKMTGALFGQPGNTWRRYACMHPGAFDSTLPALSEVPEIAAKQGEIRACLLQHGRDIGKTERQPNWCPLKGK